MADNILQWQNARYIDGSAFPADTVLTDYKPTDMTAAVEAKTISVHPHHCIALRAFGTDADNDVVVDLTISGWMHRQAQGGCGPGYRLWKGTLTLGSKSWAGSPFTTSDGRIRPPVAGTWPSATYFEVDTWEASINACGAVAQDSSINNNANRESMLILPTLGFSRLLFELPTAALGGAGEANIFGLIWRPFGNGDRIMAL